LAYPATDLHGQTGRKLAEKTVAATPDGHLEAVAWASRWPERRFALEDCRHLTRRLELDLLRAGEAAVRVPPHLTAGLRQGSRALRDRIVQSTAGVATVTAAPPGRRAARGTRARCIGLPLSL
jgi:hypothetical protein